MFDLDYLERKIEAIHEAANSVRDCRADRLAETIADAIESVHAAFEELVNVLDDASASSEVVAKNDGEKQ